MNNRKAVKARNENSLIKHIHYLSFFAGTAIILAIVWLIGVRDNRVNAASNDLTAFESIASARLLAVSAATPSLSITSPSNGATFNTSESITVRAVADPGSTQFEKVDFYTCIGGGTPINQGLDFSAPYSRTLSNLGAGTYTLIAVATDAGGASATSDPITITITGARAPIVQLVNPANNRVFEAGQTIVMNAVANPQGNVAIARVEFYNGSTKLGEDTSAPYAFAWTNVSAQTEYSLTAKAIATNGMTGTSSPALITVTPPASSVAIKDTNYPIPTDGTARFVDGDATPDGIIGDDSTGDGSLARPWKTLKKALAASPAGATVIFRAGTYRGADNRGSISKRLTLQPYRGEKVWFKGSQLMTDWQYDSAQNLWYTAFPYEFRSPSNQPDAQFVDFGRNPLAGRLEMVYINGRPLAQTARYEACDTSYTPIDCTRGAVRPGTFCLDTRQNENDSDNRLYIKDDPRGKTVEANLLEDGLSVYKNASNDTSNSIIRGLGFAHYARSAIIIGALRVQIENNTIVWNGVEGLTLGGSGDVTYNESLGRSTERQAVQLRGNTFSYNGRKGLGGSRSHNLLFENNLVSWNNIERWRTSWDAAGAKLAFGDDQVFRGNVFEDNLANGLWLDVSVTDATIVKNIARRNRQSGFYFEISSRAIIASNLAVENLQGIQISGSSKARIYNNTLVYNNRNLEIRDYNRINNRAPIELRNAEVVAGIDWETRDITIKNNIFSNATILSGEPREMVEVYEGDCNSVGFPCNENETNFAALDYNAYYRSHVNELLNLVRWKPKAIPGAPDQRFKTLATINSTVGFRTTGNEFNGWEASGGANPFFRNESGGDYRLRPNAADYTNPARNTGQPLPDTIEWINSAGEPVSVASAIGVTPGALIDRGALGNVLLPTRGKSDLVVTNIAWTPAYPTLGQAVTFRATIKNQGETETLANTVHEVDFFVDGAKVNWSRTFDGSLAPGAEATVTVSGGPSGISTWTATPGNHTIAALVDVTNLILETDESNNSRNEMLPVNALPTVSLTAPANNASLAAPLTLQTNAADSDGAISKVEFFADNVKIGEDVSAPFSLVWTAPILKSYNFAAVATDDDGAQTVSTTVVASVIRTPFGGTLHSLPGTIQAEDFDLGGEGIAYHDTTAGNNGGQYRLLENVDLKTSADVTAVSSGGYTVGWFAAGEWLEYTVKIEQAGSYKFEARVGANGAGRSFHLELDGVPLTRAIAVPNKNAWDSYDTVIVPNINLPAGQHRLRVVMGDTDFMDLNWLRLTLD